MSDTSRSQSSFQEGLQRLPGVTTLVRALKRGQQHHAKDMAASIAYFSFFSLFPLLVGIVAGASLFLESSELVGKLDDLVTRELPGSAKFVRTNVQALIELRGAAGLASIIGLLWAASKMFGAITRGINRAFETPSDRPFLVSKLRYFGMTIAVTLLTLLVVTVSTALEVLVRFDFEWLGRLSPLVSSSSSHAASFAFVLGMLVVIYRLVPNDAPAWRSVLPGALLAAALFELGKTLFVLYLQRVGNFQAVYGSLSSVVVLLLWMYFSARVLLLGAEVSAVREEGALRAQG